MLNKPENMTVLQDVDATASAAATFWLKQAKAAIAERGAFYVALAGGSTPKRLYRYLAQPDYREQVDWSRVHVFFGDERFVAPNHADSNNRMAREALLDHVPISASQIYPMVESADDTEQAVAHSAQRYEHHLQQLPRNASTNMPCFDLIMLGMGTDGHTASLFPHTSILNESEQQVAAVYVEKLNVWRISLTFPVIEAARCVLALVCGQDKATVLEKVLDSSADSDELPISRIALAQSVHWFLDEDAAARLPWRN